MDRSRTGNSIANVLTNAASQLLAVLLAFVTRTAFLRVFGTEYLGLNALFSDVLGLLSVADLGLGTAMIFRFYKPLAEKDSQQLAALACFFRRVYRGISAAVAGLGLCLVPFLPRIVRLDLPAGRLTAYYLLSLAEVAVSYLCFSGTAILNADQRGYVTVRIGMAVSVVQTVLQLAAVLYLRSYAGYLAVGAAAAMLRNLVVCRAAGRRYPFLKQRAELDIQDRRAIRENAGSILLYRVSSLLLNATDNLLIAWLESTAVVGLYANYWLIQSRLTALVSLLFSSLVASIGNLIATEGVQRRREVFQCGQTVSFLLCAVVVPCFGALVQDFLVLWLGKDCLLPGLVVCAAGINLYLGCVLQPLWSYREATGLYTRTKWVMAICAALNLALSVLLGRWLGTAGVLFASALARLLTYVWYEPRLLFRAFFGQSAAPYFWQLAGNALLTGGLALCACGLGGMVPAASWGAWLAKASVTGGLCLLAAWIVYRRREGMTLLRARLKRFRH